MADAIPTLVKAVAGPGKKINIGNKSNIELTNIGIINSIEKQIISLLKLYPDQNERLKRIKTDLLPKVQNYLKDKR
tara:strand:- start:328 stop:555 length:228 start_codon:yes stop_codon:yes gene_type:complete